MSTFQPPPTFALPVIVDPTSGKAVFNPIWLDWFIRFSQNLTPAGTPDAGDANTIIAGEAFSARNASDTSQYTETNFDALMQVKAFQHSTREFDGRVSSSTALTPVTDVYIPTQKAVKTYVDAAVAGASGSGLSRGRIIDLPNLPVFL